MNRFIRIMATGSMAIMLLSAAPASQPDRDDAPLVRIQLAEKELDRAEAMREQALAQVRQLRDELRKLTGRADVSPGGLREAITRLQEQQEQLQLDEAGAEGRRKGLAVAIDQLTVEVKKKADSDAAAVELEHVLDLRQRELKRTQELAQAHSVSQHDVEEAEIAAADARLKLIEVRRQAIGTTNSESLDAWNRELINLSVAEQERRARLTFIGNRLEQLSNALPKLDDLERQMAEAQRAERGLQEAESQLRAARHQSEWKFQSSQP
jgi:chromosome segregation ATPase